jgi:hypothetical protein
MKGSSVRRSYDLMTTEHAHSETLCGSIAGLESLPNISLSNVHTGESRKAFHMHALPAVCHSADRETFPHPKPKIDDNTATIAFVNHDIRELYSFSRLTYTRILLVATAFPCWSRKSRLQVRALAS